ncbi:MAG: hypothetical protein WB579_15230, partial [Bryobacteraceae bacterium]
SAITAVRFFRLHMLDAPLDADVGGHLVNRRRIEGRAEADPKRNRFTLAVLADDKRVEKKDRTINEPVQLYVAGNRQPYEIVVNDVKKNEVTGYLAIPKVTMARR